MGNKVNRPLGTGAIGARLLKSKQAAAFLNISERKLWELTAGSHLPCVRIGTAKRYDLSDLETFIHTTKGKK